MDKHAYASQKTIFWSSFSSATCVLGVISLAASSFTHCDVLLVPQVYFLTRENCPLYLLQLPYSELLENTWPEAHRPRSHSQMVWGFIVLSGGRGLNTLQVPYYTRLEAVSSLPTQIYSWEISSSVSLITLAIRGHHDDCGDHGHPITVLHWGSSLSFMHPQSVHSRCQQHWDGPHWGSTGVSQRYTGAWEKLSEHWLIFAGSLLTWADLVGGSMGDVRWTMARNWVGKVGR